MSRSLHVSDWGDWGDWVVTRRHWRGYAARGAIAYILVVCLLLMCRWHACVHDLCHALDLARDASPFPCAVSRDDLVRAAVQALHGCLEADKELDIYNTAVAVVGHGERFHILEGADLAPFLTGLGPAPQQGTSTAVEHADTTDDADVEATQSEATA